MELFNKKIMSVSDTLSLLTVSGKINKPSFQRPATRWNNNTKMKLIDSVMNGYALPALVIWEETFRLNYKVVDGLQRLTTLMEFKNNKFPYRSLSSATDAFLDNLFDPKAAEIFYGFDDEEKELKFISELELKYNNSKRSFRVMTKQEKNFFNMYELDITMFNPQATEEYCRDAFIRINSEAKTLSRTELNLALYDNEYIETLRHIYSGDEQLQSEQDIVKFWHSCGYRLMVDKSSQNQASHVIKQILNKIDTFVEQHIVLMYLFEITKSTDGFIKDVNLSMRQIKSNAYNKVKNKTKQDAVTEFYKIKSINEKISEFKVPDQHNKDHSQISCFKLIHPTTKKKKYSTLYMFGIQCIFNNIMDDMNKQKYFDNSFSSKFKEFYELASTKHETGILVEGTRVKITSNASDSSKSIHEAFKFVGELFKLSFTNKEEVLTLKK